MISQRVRAALAYACESKAEIRDDLWDALCNVVAAAEEAANCDAEYQAAKREGTGWSDFYSYWMKENQDRKDAVKDALNALDAALRECE